VWVLWSVVANVRRDDLTVEVIFFGEGAANGSVTLNRDASAAAPEAKAKL
jgi:pyruvate dehydrogenase phosphatase